MMMQGRHGAPASTTSQLWTGPAACWPCGRPARAHLHRHCTAGIHAAAADEAPTSSAPSSSSRLGQWTTGVAGSGYLARSRLVRTAKDAEMLRDAAEDLVAPHVDIQEQQHDAEGQQQQQQRQQWQQRGRWTYTKPGVQQHSRGRRDPAPPVTNNRPPEAAAVAALTAAAAAFAAEVQSTRTTTELNNLTSHMQLQDLSLLHLGAMCCKLLAMQSYWSKAVSRAAARNDAQTSTTNTAAAADGADGSTDAQQQPVHSVVAEGRGSSGLAPPANSPAGCVPAAYIMRRCFHRMKVLLPLKSAAPEAGVPPAQLAGALTNVLEAAAVVCWVAPGTPTVGLAVEQYVASARLAWQQLQEVAGRIQQPPPQQQQHEEADIPQQQQQQQQRQSQPPTRRQQQQAGLSLGRDFLRCARSLAVLAQVCPGCIQPGTWTQLAELSVQQLPAIVAAAAAGRRGGVTGGRQQSNGKHRASRDAGPDSSSRLQVLWDVWLAGTAAQPQQQQQQQQQQPPGKALDRLLATAARSLAAGGPLPYLEAMAALVAAAPSQEEGQQLLAAAAPVTRQLLPHCDLETLVAVFSLHFAGQAHGSKAGGPDGICTQQGSSQSSSSRSFESDVEGTSSSSTTTSTSATTGEVNIVQASSSSSSSNNSRVLQLLEPLCSELLLQDLRRLTLQQQQLLADRMEVLYLLPSSHLAAAAPQLLEQLRALQAASGQQPAAPSEQRGPRQQQQQQQQQKAVHSAGRGNAVGQYQRIKLQRLLSQARPSLVQVAELVGQQGHTMDLYGLGYLQYKVGELILHLGLDKQLTQQQQPPPQQQQQQQQEVEAGRKPHQQQQQQQAAVAHDLLQQLENLVARLLPTAAEDALSKQQNPLLPLSSITYSWARVGYKPYHGTVVRLTEQFVAVLEQLVEAGMVAALQQQQQRNGPGSGARQPGQQGSIPSSPDSSMDEDALLGSPPLPTTPTTSSSSSSSESMPGAAAPAAAATRFPSRQALCRVLCNFVWALCKLHPGSPAWVPLAAAFTQLSPLLGPRDIASIAYAWAAAGRRDVVLFARLASLAEAQVEGFKEQALPNLLWAYATVQCHHQALFYAAAPRLLRLMRTLTPQGLSNALWAYGKVGLCPPGFLEAAYDHLQTRDFSKFKPTELATTSWGLARLQRLGPPLPFIGTLQAKIAGAAVQRLAAFSLTDFMTLMVGQSYSDVYYQPLLKAAGKRLAEELQKPAADVTALMPALFVLAKAGQEELQLVSLLLRRCQEQAERLVRDAQACSLLLNALSCWRYRDDCMLTELWQAVQAVDNSSSSSSSSASNGGRGVKDARTLYSQLLGFDSDDSEMVEGGNTVTSSASSRRSDGEEPLAAITGTSSNSNGSGSKQSSSSGSGSGSGTKPGVLHSWTQSALTVSCVSMARVGYSQPPHLSLFDQLLTAFLDVVDRESPHAGTHREHLLVNCIQVLWSCAVMEVKHEPVLGRLVQALAAAHNQQQQLQQRDVPTVNLGQLHQARMYLELLPKGKALVRQLPAGLLQQARQMWLQQVDLVTVSGWQKDVAQQLEALGLRTQLEQKTKDGYFSLDVAVTYNGQRVAVEVNGPDHYVANVDPGQLTWLSGLTTGDDLQPLSAPADVQSTQPGAGYLVLMGPDCLRLQLLEARGWRVLPISVYELGQARARSEYAVRQLLQSRLEAATAAAPPSALARRRGSILQGMAGAAAAEVGGGSSGSKVRKQVPRAAGGRHRKVQQQEGQEEAGSEGGRAVRAVSAPSRQEQQSAYQQSYDAVQESKKYRGTSEKSRRGSSTPRGRGKEGQLAQALAVAAVKGAAKRGSRAAAAATKSRVAGKQRGRELRQGQGELAGGDSSMVPAPEQQLEEFSLELDDLFAAVGQDADPVRDSGAPQ